MAKIDVTGGRVAITLPESTILRTSSVVFIGDDALGTNETKVAYHTRHKSEKAFGPGTVYMRGPIFRDDFVKVFTEEVDIVLPPLNNAPDVVNDSVTTAYETAVSIAVLSNDTDADDDAISITTFTQGSNGTVTQLSSNLVYTPDTGFSGTDTFTYSVTDGTDTASGVVTVTVEEEVVVITDPSTPAELRTYLLDQIGVAGRKSTATLVTPTAAMAGVAISGREITVTGSDRVFTDVDFTDYIVNDRATGSTYSNCVFGRSGTIDVDAGANNHLRIWTNSTLATIVDCDFIGYKGRTPGSVENDRLVESAAINQDNYPSGPIELIARNRFKWLPQDGIKTSSVKRVEYNVLYAFSNVNVQPVLWTAGTYNTGDEVLVPGNPNWVAVARIDGVTSEPPSTSGVTGSNTDWQLIDPHCDAINVKQNYYPGSVFFRNLVMRDPQDSRIPASDRSFMIKMVNSYRMVKNSNSTGDPVSIDATYDTVVLQENGSFGVSPTGTSGAIDVSKTGEVGTSKYSVELRDNLLDDENGYHVGVNNPNVANWYTNYDATDLSEITRPANAIDGDSPAGYPDVTLSFASGTETQSISAGVLAAGSYTFTATIDIEGMGTNNKFRMGTNADLNTAGTWAAASGNASADGTYTTGTLTLTADTEVFYGIRAVSSPSPGTIALSGISIDAV